MALLNTTWSTNPLAVAAPTAAQLVASTTAAAFQAWPPAAQATFLAANGSGNPPQAVLSSGAGHTLFTLMTGTQVEAEAVPPAFSDPAAQMDYGTFASWSDNLKLAYLQFQAGASRSNAHVALGSGGDAFSASVTLNNLASLSPGTSPSTPSITVTAPKTASGVSYPASQLTPDFVFNLPASDLSALLSGTSNARPFVFPGTTGGQVVPIREGATTLGYVLLPTNAYARFFSPLTQDGAGTQKPNLSLVDPAAFAAWPPVVQIAYFQHQLGLGQQGPATLGVGQNTETPITFLSDPDVSGDRNFSTVVFSGKAGTLDFGAVSQFPQTAIPGVASSPTVETFLSWSTQSQQAFVAAQPGRSIQLSTADGAGHLAIKKDGATATGFTLSSSMPAGSTLSATDMELFGFLSPGDQASYVGNHGTTSWSGGSSGMTVGTYPGGTLLIAPKGSNAVGAYPIPAAFATAPANLDSGTFLSWPTSVQAYYIARNGTAIEGAPTAPAGQTTFRDGATYGLDEKGTVGQYRPALADFSSQADIQKIARPTSVLDTAANQKASNTLFFGTGANPLPDLSIPSVATFGGWTVAQRAAFIEAKTANTGQSYVTLGSGATAVDVFVSQTLLAGGIPKVYVVQNLQKTAIAAMSFKDQAVLAKIPGFASVATNLNLIPADGGAMTTNAAGKPVTVAARTVAALLTDARTMFTTGTNLPQLAQAVFTGEIDLIAAQLFGTAIPDPNAKAPGTAPTLPPSPQTGGSAIFSTADIQNAINAIEDRFKRANAFAPAACEISHYDLGGNTVSDFQKFKGYNNSTNSDNRYTDYQEYSTTYNLSEVKSSSGSDHIHIDTTDTLFYQTGPGQFKALTESQIASLSGPNVPWIGRWGQIVAGTQLQSDTNFTSDTNPLGSGDPLPFGGSTPFHVFVLNETYTVTSNPNTGATLDNGAGAASGYVTFMNQEQAVLANRVAAAKLANSGTLTDPATGLAKALDLPSLLCLFMTFNSNAQQALTTADSEEVNQANAVLQNYAAMQAVINSTTAHATTNANDNLTINYGSQDQNVGGLFSGSRGESPIEVYYFNSAYRRPSISLANQTVAQWTADGTQLSDAVTQINQQTQIKMNAITNETKQQDRYFDLASTALSKLNETLQQIGSAV